ncbi:unnamed protein product [Amoebophrya sp. A120]|nr:unnamed protein product [Amoebophrya sp. A120]|eukprot:GSA120T00006813001.1
MVAQDFGRRPTTSTGTQGPRRTYFFEGGKNDTVITQPNVATTASGPEFESGADPRRSFPFQATTVRGDKVGERYLIRFPHLLEKLDLKWVIPAKYKHPDQLRYDYDNVRARSTPDVDQHQQGSGPIQEASSSSSSRQHDQNYPGTNGPRTNSSATKINHRMIRMNQRQHDEVKIFFLYLSFGDSCADGAGGATSFVQPGAASGTRPPRGQEVVDGTTTTTNSNLHPGLGCFQTSPSDSESENNLDRNPLEWIYCKLPAGGGRAGAGAGSCTRGGSDGSRNKDEIFSSQQCHIPTSEQQRKQPQTSHRDNRMRIEASSSSRSARTSTAPAAQELEMASRTQSPNDSGQPRPCDEQAGIGPFPDDDHSGGKFPPRSEGDEAGPRFGNSTTVTSIPQLIREFPLGPVENPLSIFCQKHETVVEYASGGVDLTVSRPLVCDEVQHLKYRARSNALSPPRGAGPSDEKQRREGQDAEEHLHTTAQQQLHAPAEVDVGVLGARSDDKDSKFLSNSSLPTPSSSRHYSTISTSWSLNGKGLVASTSNSNSTKPDETPADFLLILVAAPTPAAGQQAGSLAGGRPAGAKLDVGSEEDRRNNSTGAHRPKIVELSFSYRATAEFGTWKGQLIKLVGNKNEESQLGDPACRAPVLDHDAGDAVDFARPVSLLERERQTSVHLQCSAPLQNTGFPANNEDMDEVVAYDNSKSNTSSPSWDKASPAQKDSVNDCLHQKLCIRWPPRIAAQVLTHTDDDLHHLFTHLYPTPEDRQELTFSQAACFRFLPPAFKAVFFTVMLCVNRIGSSGGVVGNKINGDREILTNADSDDGPQAVTPNEKSCTSQHPGSSTAASVSFSFLFPLLLAFCAPAERLVEEADMIAFENTKHRLAGRSGASSSSARTRSGPDCITPPGRGGGARPGPPSSSRGERKADPRGGLSHGKKNNKVVAVDLFFNCSSRPGCASSSSRNPLDQNFAGPDEVDRPSRAFSFSSSSEQHACSGNKNNRRRNTTKRNKVHGGIIKQSASSGTVFVNGIGKTEPPNRDGDNDDEDGESCEVSTSGDEEDTAYESFMQELMARK